MLGRGGEVEGVDNLGGGVQGMGDMMGDDLGGTNNNDTDSSDEEEVDDLSISFMDEQSNIEATNKRCSKGAG